MENKIEFSRKISMIPSKEEYRVRNKLDMSKDSQWIVTNSSY